MAIISGFLVFTLVGRNKHTLQPEADLLRAEHSISDHSGPRELPTISKGKSGYRTPAAPSAPARADRNAAANSADRLRDLYTDEQFVSTTVQRWKRAVADAHETHTIRPDVLMSNIIVRAYLGEYGQREFRQDVAEHAGDCAMSAASALKAYEYGWSMSRVMQQYSLSRYFPAPEAPTAAQFKPKSKVAEANLFSAKGSKSAEYSAPKITKPAATTSAAEAGFRAMVAKEEGFSSWAGLQKLGDQEQKQNAERRVKRLLSAARVK
ncbi:MAG TPA: hypothetical protein PKD78_01335 [Saprospiraceae bacterium]|nr:hypothetical protein [Saprospiraceae bacterium]HNG90877.1 hypothetical protein [Saprospiraceae bacterium]